jgi:O-glycosyl hydrolase
MLSADITVISPQVNSSSTQSTLKGFIAWYLLRSCNGSNCNNTSI